MTNDDTFPEQGLKYRASLTTDIDIDKVCFAWDRCKSERGQSLDHLLHPCFIHRPTSSHVFLVTEGGEGGTLRKAIGIEGRAHSIQEIGDLCCREAVPNSQSGEAVDFGKCPQDNHVPPLLHISHRVRKLRASNILEVGFVEHHEDMRRDTRKQKLDLIG